MLLHKRLRARCGCGSAVYVVFSKRSDDGYRARSRG
jgi:hypothetical protein